MAHNTKGAGEPVEDVLNPAGCIKDQAPAHSSVAHLLCCVQLPARPSAASWVGVRRECPGGSACWTESVAAAGQSWGATADTAQDTLAHATPAHSTVTCLGTLASC